MGGTVSGWEVTMFVGWGRDNELRMSLMDLFSLLLLGKSFYSFLRNLFSSFSLHTKHIPNVKYHI